jgi:hypothetical protein
MSDLKIRCSSLGRIMTEPLRIDPSLLTEEVAEIVAKKKRSDDEKDLIQSLKDQTLSAGGKTYVRELAAQDIFGVDFVVSGKALEKGIRVEDEAIELLNRVRGLSLKKNTERRENDWLTGECDLFDAGRRVGSDIKCSWSIASFPLVVVDCEDALYDWQMTGYMSLWDAPRWSVDYCLVNTPEDLVGYEPIQLHIVDHIPEHMRVTSWHLQREAAKEALIKTKVQAARRYYAQIVDEFERTHHATPGVVEQAVASASRAAEQTAQATGPYVMSPRLAALLGATA